MKRILFTHSYFLRFDPKQWETGRPYPPLGTLYALSLMRTVGYEVALFDSMFAEGPEEVNPYLENFQPDLFVVYDDGFNYLTKMCLTNMREAAFSMIRKAKAKGCTVILSSSDSTDHYEKYLDAGADFVILGEAEKTLEELVHTLGSEATACTAIKGLAFKQQETLIKTPARPVMRDLDALPLPAWDLVDFSPYRNMWMNSSGYFSLNQTTTRGCPFKCNWCAKPIYGNRYNSRSPEQVVRELKLLKEMSGFDHIWFCDDIFGLKPGWVAAFAGLVEKEGLSLKFKMQGRVDLLLQENYIHDLARAGCENVWMGAESGSQRILDAMEKGTTVEQIGEASRLLKKNGIRPSFFIQFGYLGETKEDIRATIRMINKLLPGEIGISVSYPLPGTGFYEKVKSDMQEKRNWADSDEMALMFRNTYQPAFYKQLYRYVHRSYRLHIGLHNLKKIFSKPWQWNGSVWKKAISTFYHAPLAWLAGTRLQYLEKTS